MKNMKKRLLSVLLLFSLLTTFGCGGPGASDTPTPTLDNTGTTAPIEAAKPPQTPAVDPTAAPTEIPASPTEAPTVTPAEENPDISGGEDETGEPPVVEITGMEYRLWYDTPARDGYSDWEKKSLPVGNSSIGGNVFGRYDKEHITLNEKSFWTGGPSTSRPDYIGGNIAENGNYGETLAEVQRLFLSGNTEAGQKLCEKLVGTWDGYGGYQLFGNLYMDFGTVSKKEVSGYYRDLNLKTGIASVVYDKNDTHYEREIFTSYPENVMVIHLTAEGTDTLNFVLSLEPENTDPAKRITTIHANGNQIDFYGTLDDNQLQYSAFLTVLTGTEGTVAPQDDTKLAISNAREVTILLSMGTDYENTYPAYRTGESMEELKTRVRACVDSAAKKSYETLRAYHVADIWEMMDRVEVDFGQQISDMPTNDLLTAYKKDSLPQEERAYLETLLYQYGRYLLISSSRGETLPANLQGIWVGKNGSDWSSDYHINVNLQMNYWHVYSTNLTECALPLIDYVEGLREPGRVTAEIYFGVTSDAEHPENGFTANTQTTPFGWTCPGWSFDWGWSPAAVPWIIQNVWEYYEYTLDEDMLKEQIYPIMKEQAIFYQQILVEDENGELISTPSYSPEQGPRTNGNTYEQTLVWQLFTDTITAAEIIGEDAALIAEWKEVLANLKDPIEIGTDGQIKEWYHETYLGSITSAENYNHRHISHLLGLYPGDLISEETPEWFDAALVSMQNRTDKSTGWAMGQRINTWARLGNGEKVYELIGLLFDSGIYPNLWDTHPPFQIDGNFGYTSGVTEALMQSNMGYINLLPALPDEWADGSFRGLVARGNFEVAMTWNDKTASKITILSKNGGTCTVQFEASENVTITDANGNPVSFTKVKENRFSFETEKGETYTIINTFPYSAPQNFSAKRVSDYEVDLSWTGVEGANEYVVYRALNDGDFTEVLRTNKTSTTDVTAVTMSFEDTYTYQVAALATDGSHGIFSFPAEAGTLSNAIIDSNHSKVVYTGDWSVFMESDHYDGTNNCSWTPGAAAELTFTGTGIEVYSVAKSNYNAFKITVDGTAYADYYSAYAPSTTPDTLICSIEGLESGTHTLRIEVMEDKVTPANDHSVSLDYFKILSGAEKTPVSSLTVVSKNQVTLLTEIGQSISLTANALPADATYKAVSWSLKDTSGAPVDEVNVSADGIVTVTGACNGTISVTATALDGSGATGSVELQISTAEGPVTSRNHLYQTDMSLFLGRAYNNSYTTKWLTDGAISANRFASVDNGSDVGFEVTFSNEKTMNTLLIYERTDLSYDQSNPGGGNSRFNKVDIQVYDGSEWVTKATATADYSVIDNNTVLHELTFDAVSGESFRFILYHNGQGTGGITLWEMEAYYRTNTVESADYSALTTALDKAALCIESDFTATQYKEFQTVLTSAVLCANDATATQADVDTAVKELEKSVNGLTLTVSCKDIDVMVPSAQLGVGFTMPLLVLGEMNRGFAAEIPAKDLSVTCKNGLLTFKNGRLTALFSGEETITVTTHGITKEIKILVTEN